VSFLSDLHWTHPRMKTSASTFHASDAPERTTGPIEPTKSKTQAQHDVSLCAFIGSRPGPPELEKCCVDVSCLKRTRTHYVTSRSHQMEKHKFHGMCPCVLLLGSTLGPLEHGKVWGDVSCPKQNRTHYKTHT
jgi:hypothetical protein